MSGNSSDDAKTPKTPTTNPKEPQTSEQVPEQPQSEQQPSEQETDIAERSAEDTESIEELKLSTFEDIRKIRNLLNELADEIHGIWLTSSTKKDAKLDMEHVFRCIEYKKIIAELKEKLVVLEQRCHSFKS